MNTFEAYTEIMGGIDSSCYLLARLISSKDRSKCYHIFDAFVSTEIEFSKFQSSKVLDLLKLDKDVNKETNVTSYYLIKTELYCSLNSFLQYCINNNDNFIKLMDKIKYLEYLKKIKRLEIKKLIQI